MSNLEELEDEIITLKDKVRALSRLTYDLPPPHREYSFNLLFSRYLLQDYDKIYNNPIYQKNYMPSSLLWEIEDSFEHERELILEYGFRESALN